MADKSVCSIPGCGKGGRQRRGLCSSHYQRMMRHGDPHAGRVANGEPDRFLREEVLTYDGDECIFWPYAHDGHGYPRMNVDGKLVGVHRMVCKEVNGPPPGDDYDAAHSCGKGHLGCLTKRHLSWKTRSENFADKEDHGTVVRGEAVHNAKLTEDKVRAIRALQGKKTQKQIAAMFGITSSWVGMIHRRLAWAWM